MVPGMAPGDGVEGPFFLAENCVYGHFASFCPSDSVSRSYFFWSLDSVPWVHFSGFISANSMTLFIFAMKVSSGTRAIPFSSERTIRRCPPDKPKRSRAPFGITI